MDLTLFPLFASLVTALVLEAMPFLALGALISALVEVFAPLDLVERRMPKSPAAQILLGLTAGMILPTCECGSVPIVRRFLQKGVPARAAITYMLAAPVVNPVVLAATWAAFKGDWTMIAYRVFLVVIPAVAVGLVLGRAAPTELLRFSLAKGPQALTPLEAQCTSGCDCGCDHGVGPGRNRLFSVLSIAAGEFLETGAFLVLGACAASLFKVLTPASAVNLFAQNLPLAVAALMLLAIALTVCSEADAFVAASLSMFPRPALLAFLALGPMLDLKLLPAYFTVFKRRVALAVALVPAVIIYVLTMSLGLFGGVR